MGKVVEVKKFSGEIPAEIEDGRDNLKSISGKLKVLLAAARGSEFDHDELSGFVEIARLTLGGMIEELDGIITDIEECFGMKEVTT